MKHLTDELLNEYLDHEAEDPAGIEEHLASCAECTSRLAEFKSLFAELASLPEASITRPVVIPLAKAYALPRWLTWTAAVQSAIALAAIIIAVPFLADLLPKIDTRVLVDLAVEAQSQWTGLLDLLSQVQIPSMPEIPFAEFSSLMTALAGVSVLWLLGNGLLLKNQMK